MVDDRTKPPPPAKIVNELDNLKSKLNLVSSDKELRRLKELKKLEELNEMLREKLEEKLKARGEGGGEVVVVRAVAERVAARALPVRAKVCGEGAHEGS